MSQFEDFLNNISGSNENFENMDKDNAWEAYQNDRKKYKLMDQLNNELIKTLSAIRLLNEWIYEYYSNDNVSYREFIQKYYKDPDTYINIDKLYDVPKVPTNIVKGILGTSQFNSEYDGVHMVLRSTNFIPEFLFLN